MEYSKLPSGLQVVSEHIPHVRTVALGIWVRCGTYGEQDKEAGMSHFLEHMFFKGTETRSAREIVEAFDDVGGELNAYTTKEYTCFYAKVIDEHLPLAVEVIMDMLCHPRMSVADIEKEKQVILEEISMCEDVPDELIHDCLAATIWPEHPLGRPILGSRSSINALTQEGLLDYYNRHYFAQNIVVAAAGNLSHQDLLELLHEHCSFTHSAQKGEWHQADISYTEKVNAIERPIEQLHMCLGFPGLSWKSESIYTLNVLNNIFGGGMSSRLFQEIREERGLAYNIYSYSASFVPAGYFSIYAGLSAERFPLVMSTLAEEIKKLKSAQVSPEELARAKQQVKGALVIGLESTANRMSRMGRSLLLMGRVNEIDEIVAKMEAVTARDVVELANAMLQGSRASLCVLGPTSQLSELDSYISSLV